MFKSAFVLSLAVSSAYGHAFINSVSGANGLSAVGLGVGAFFRFLLLLVNGGIDSMHS